MEKDCIVVTLTDYLKSFIISCQKFLDNMGSCTILQGEFLKLPDGHDHLFCLVLMPYYFQDYPKSLLGFSNHPLSNSLLCPSSACFAYTF